MTRAVVEFLVEIARSPMHSFFRLLLILIILPLIGTLGFHWIEGWRWIDSLYMAFITLSTVGYELVHPLSDAGKVFIIVYLGLGFSVFFYSLTQIGEMAVGGDLQRLLRRRIMNRQIKDLDQHFIICGLGRMGSGIAKELFKKNHPFVVIERNPKRIEAALEEGWRCIEGDATNDEVLRTAGIERARCLATVLPHDADNLFTVMSARLLNKELTLITRTSDEASVDKMKRAGATRIISPYSIGAVKISQLMINPQLEEFIEIFGEHDLDIDLTVVKVHPHSPLRGRTLKHVQQEVKGLLVVGLRREGQKLLMPPPEDEALQTKDSLIVVGPSRAMRTFMKSLDASLI